MADDATPVTLTYAVRRKTTQLTLSKIEPGVWRATAQAERARALSPDRRHAEGGDGGRSAQSERSRRHARDRRHSEAPAEATGGSVHWLADGGCRTSAA